MSDLEKDTPPALFEGERLWLTEERTSSEEIFFRIGAGAGMGRECLLGFTGPDSATGLVRRLVYARNIIDGPLLPVEPNRESVRRLLHSMPEVSAEESRHHDIVMAYKAVSEISSFLSEVAAELPEPSRNLSAGISALGSALHRLSRVAEYLKAASDLTPGGDQHAI